MFIAVLAMMASVSCGEQEKSYAPIMPESMLMRQLTQYNAEVAKSHPETRGIGRFTAIVSADFLGACDGAVKGARIGFRAGMLLGGRGLEGAAIGGTVMGLVCGAGASYAASAALSSEEVAPELDASFFISKGQFVRCRYLDSFPSGRGESAALTELDLPEVAVSVGELHNEILDIALEEDEAGAMVLLSSPPDLDSDDDSPSSSDLEAIIFDSAEMSDTCSTLFDLYYSEGVSITENGLAADVANTFLALIQNYTLSLDDLATHINNYYHYISESQELSDDDKNGLYCGLAVAYYSYEYWIGND